MYKIMDHYDCAYEKFNEYESKKEDVDLDDFEEFMRKVEEVNKMVHALASGDKAQVEEATKTADTWLANQKSGKSDDRETAEEIIHDPSRNDVKSRRDLTKKSAINNKQDIKKPKPPTDLTHLDTESMSQEDFMKSVEEDAKKRSEDRKCRIIESDAIKLNANKAFREGDFEKALDLYNKAIEVRKDSCVLYTNRALTLLNLELYSRALQDCETALKLDEGSFKARLYKWHAYHEMGEDEKAEESLGDVKSMFQERLAEIEEYEKKVCGEDEE